MVKPSIRSSQQSIDDGVGKSDFTFVLSNQLESRQAEKSRDEMNQQEEGNSILI